MKGNKLYKGFNTTQELHLFNKYFKFSDFDSPDEPGSGEKYMDREFLYKLATAREHAQIYFVINNGHRTSQYNQLLIRKGYKASPNSSHLKGLAADISAVSGRQKMVIVRSLILAGFTRIGIGDTFIHVDLDREKTQNTIWTY